MSDAITTSPRQSQPIRAIGPAHDRRHRGRARRPGARGRIPRRHPAAVAAPGGQGARRRRRRRLPGTASSRPSPGTASRSSRSTSADGSRPVPGYPGQPPFVRGRGPAGNRSGWDVRQRHEHPDPAVAREQIMEDLEGGVSSLWLGLGDGRIPVEPCPTCSRRPTSTWRRSSSTRASGSPRRRRCTSTSPRAGGCRPARWPAAWAPTRSACWRGPASRPAGTGHHRPPSPPARRHHR